MISPNHPLLTRLGEQQRPRFGLWWSRKGHRMLRIDTHWSVAAVIVSANATQILTQAITARTTFAMPLVRVHQKPRVLDFDKPTNDRTVRRIVS